MVTDVDLLHERPEDLTDREMDVLRLLCRPDCVKEKDIPDLLFISRSTFDTHRNNIYRKLKVHSRQALYIVAVRLGLVPCACGGRSEEVAEER